MDETFSGRKTQNIIQKFFYISKRKLPSEINISSISDDFFSHWIRFLRAAQHQAWLMDLVSLQWIFCSVLQFTLSQSVDLALPGQVAKVLEVPNKLGGDVKES